MPGLKEFVLSMLPSNGPKDAGLLFLIRTIKATRTAIEIVEQDKNTRTKYIRELKTLQEAVEADMRKDLQSQQQAHMQHHNKVVDAQTRYRTGSTPTDQQKFAEEYLKIVEASLGPPHGGQVNMEARASMDDSIIRAVQTTQAHPEQDIDKVVDDLLSNCFPPRQGVLSRGFRVLWPWTTTPSNEEAGGSPEAEDSQHDVRPSATWTVRTSGIYSGIDSDVEAESSSEA